MSIRSLPKNLQERAEKEINEVPRRIREDLDHIKEWIAKQPHSKYITREDQWLLNYLRGCKFSLQQAKQKYNVYCAARLTASEFFGYRDPFQLEIQETLNGNILIILPELSNSLAPRRFLILAKNANPETMPFKLLVKVLATMVGEIITLEDDGCFINGQEAIIDCHEAPHNYIIQITPSVLKNAVIIVQKAFASRIVGFHFINVPSYILPLLTLFKSLLLEKLSDRVHFYSKNNIEELYEFVPKSTLPEEYGGNAGTIDKLSKDLKLKIESYSEWFIKDSNRCNLDKTELRMVTASLESFAMDESFRKLDID